MEKRSFSDKSGRVTPLQEEFLELYFLTNYICDAADKIGISERTARRYLKLPHVLSRLEEMRQERREAVREQLNTCMEYAVEIIREKLRKGAHPRDGEYIDSEHVFKYVALMLKYAAPLAEIDALKERIAELEAAQEQAIEGTVTRLPVRSEVS